MTTKAFTVNGPIELAEIPAGITPSAGSVLIGAKGNRIITVDETGFEQELSPMSFATLSKWSS